MRTGDRRVGAGDFHEHHAIQCAAVAGAAAPLVGEAGNVELAEPVEDLEREPGSCPVVVDDRFHLIAHERAHGVQNGELARLECPFEAVEVTRGQRASRHDISSRVESGGVTGVIRRWRSAELAALYPYMSWALAPVRLVSTVARAVARIAVSST
jgi:hypothetical protein